MDKLERISDYRELIRKLKHEDYPEEKEMLRYLCRTDLFFLLWFALGRADIAKPWLLERCREVQESPNGHLDLWSRAHYKSSVITFGKTIQDILASHGDNPLPEWGGREVTFGIFSCTRPIAKGFLRQIKREFEQNEVLRTLFPDILWDNPRKEAPKWSDDDGLIIRRQSNPKESTIEAWGIVDGQPTSKHFMVCVYDDVVTIDSVRSPHMIEKVTEAWELSLNLGQAGGYRRYIGTRYHFNDTYKVIMDRKGAIPRIYKATKDGSVSGEPVLLTRGELEEKYRMMGPYIFASQMLQNPSADESQGFKYDWVKYYEYMNPQGMNVYMLIDPANSKKSTSDFTAITVIGLSQDNNYYILDFVRDRLNIKERGKILMNLHKKWKPKAIGYERYGMLVDLAYIERMMEEQNYRMNIVELGGKASKEDRIKALIPLFQDGRVYLPQSCYKTNYEGKTFDLVDVFVQQEYLAFPVSEHDDMLDSLARILDPKLNAIWPMVHTKEQYKGRSSPKYKGWAA